MPRIIALWKSKNPFATNVAGGSKMKIVTRQLSANEYVATIENVPTAPRGFGQTVHEAIGSLVVANFRLFGVKDYVHDPMRHDSVPPDGGF